MTQQLPVEDVDPNPHNPRENFEKIGELADSIEEQGQLTPVLVRPKGGGYELVHGERRLRAIQQLDKPTIRAEVRDLSDEEALQKSISENLQREDVTELAEARSYQTLCDEFGMTQAEVAEKIGKSQPHVANRLALLDMPDVLRRDILHKIFSPWHARILASNWDKYMLRDFARKHELSVSELRDVVSQLDDGKERVTLRREMPISREEDVDIDDIALSPEEVEKTDTRRRIPLDECVIEDVPKAYEENNVPPEERAKVGPYENFQLWADKRIDGFEFERPYDPAERTPEGEDPQPIVDDVVTPSLYLPESQLSVTGTVLVTNALKEGYEGDIAVNLEVSRSWFDINKQPVECPDCHGQAYLKACTIDCPECGGPHELNPKNVGVEQ